MMRQAAIVGAFVRRDWRIDLSYRLPFVVETIAVGANLALFFYLSRFVDTPDFAGRTGLEGGYFSFVAIGIALLGIVQTGLSSFALRLRTDQTTGTFEALLATPTASWVVIVGTAAYDMLRATITGVVIVAASVLVFGLDLRTDPSSVAAAVLGLVGCVLLFAAIGVALAAFTVVFKQTLGIVNLVVIGLGLLSGAFFPLSVLPGPLESLAEGLPLSWGFEVVRQALLAGDVAEGKLALLLAAAALALPASLFVVGRALDRARRAGSLSQY